MHHLLSAEIWRSWMSSVWPHRTKVHRPVAVSQTRPMSVPLKSAMVTAALPSGQRAPAMMLSLKPSSTRMHWPLRMSHRRATRASAVRRRSPLSETLWHLIGAQIAEDSVFVRDPPACTRLPLRGQRQGADPGPPAAVAADTWSSLRSWIRAARPLWAPAWRVRRQAMCAAMRPRASGKAVAAGALISSACIRSLTSVSSCASR
mmetsp:Transcript_4353/g.10545  ORF Transcript_4353/g.10545 Transcript_4353/m.10545 type:complete len:204 (-) Transcript_4353:741-1352(-)